MVDHSDMALLMIAGWCKHLPAGMEQFFRSGVFSASRIETLVKQELLAYDRRTRAVRLRPAGYRLLQLAGYDFPQDMQVRSETETIMRRCVACMIAATFYRAGIYVFCQDNQGLQEEQTYLPSFTYRRGKFSKNNLLNSTIFSGIYRGRDTAYLVFYVTGKHEYAYTANELKIFNQVIEQTDVKNLSVIFMGGSTLEIGHMVFQNGPEKSKAVNKSKAEHFSTVFWSFKLPVRFIPAGDSGAQVLKFLQLPNYRETIARAVMRGSYRPPYDGLPDTDAVHYEKPHNPAVIGIDMDVKRIDRAIASAKENGFRLISKSWREKLTGRLADY